MILVVAEPLADTDERFPGVHPGPAQQAGDSTRFWLVFSFHQPSSTHGSLRDVPFISCLAHQGI